MTKSTWSPVACQHDAVGSWAWSSYVDLVVSCPSRYLAIDWITNDYFNLVFFNSLVHFCFQLHSFTKSSFFSLFYCLQFQIADACNIIMKICLHNGYSVLNTWWLRNFCQVFNSILVSWTITTFVVVAFYSHGSIVDKDEIMFTFQYNVSTWYSYFNIIYL